MIGRAKKEPGCKLIVGLGNPGLAYRSTRHNIGFAAVERLARENRFFFKLNRSFKSLIASGKIKNLNVCLALPQTFMNLSGEAVVSIVRKKHIPLSDILIVSDDVALPLGTIKIKPRGSDGGHKGLASCIEKLGTREIPRLRIGIGREDKTTLTDFVLSRFDKSEEPVLNKALLRAVEAIEVWTDEGIDACMNRFNIKAKS